MKILLLLALCALPVSAQTIPSQLSGTWVQTLNDKTGTMLITQRQIQKDKIEGKISITNSTFCNEPVPFLGTILGDHVEIVSTEEVVCGYRGVLRGVVSKAPDGEYVGSFEYRFIGLTWARGTFRLIPKVDGVQ